MHNREKVILVVAFIGMLLAGYALPLHYADGGESICNVNETFNCDKVNKSQWSELFGIPVALLGLLVNLFLFLAVLKRKWLASVLSFTQKDVWQYLLIIVGVMLVFQIYLTMVEILYIKAFCIVCLANQALVLILFPCVYFSWRNASEK